MTAAAAFVPNTSKNKAFTPYSALPGIVWATAAVF
jgi:hypothetical protein